MKTQYDLKHLIDSEGNLICSDDELLRAETLALEVMESFLECTIVVDDKKFILSSLELYYGGIADMADDWYRSSFPAKYNNLKKSKHSKINTLAQITKGPIYYMNQKGEGRFKRCDIVVGSEGVAISFLIRNVLDTEHHPLADKKGQPNLVLKKMGLSDEYQMTSVEIIDTREEVLAKGFRLVRQMRVIGGKASGFGYDGLHDKKLWNLSLVGI